MTPEMSTTPTSTTGIASAVRAGIDSRSSSQASTPTNTTWVLPSTVSQARADQRDGVVEHLEVDGEEEPGQPRQQDLRARPRTIGAALG